MRSRSSTTAWVLAGMCAWLGQVGWVQAGDPDGDIDLADFAAFVACLAGPDEGLSPGSCGSFDYDDDRDVDLADVAAFQRAFTGPVAPPGMVLIPGGEFWMGDTFGEGYPYELPIHAVDLGRYYVDQYEVTNAQYAAALNWAWAQGGLITITGGGECVAATGTGYPYCDTTISSPWSRITWSGSAFGVTPGKGNHPMGMVSWYGSVAYCNWRSGMEGKPLCYDPSTWACNFGVGGYRLPTEAEWEKAARGGVEVSRFPWSDEDAIQHTRANYHSSTSLPYDTSPTLGYHPTFGTGAMPYTSPVGYFAANGCGVYDMAGNVWEWCNDWYSDTYYSISPGLNPRGPTSGVSRVLRGGSWSSYAIYARCAFRFHYAPDYRNLNNGFRVALGSE